MERIDIAATVALIASFLILFAGVGGLVDVWLDEGYDIDQAVEWNWRARASNDLEEMANYLETANAKLERFSGNPKWFRPTPDTDWDLIKGSIQENIDVAREVAAITDKGDMSYQFEVQNIQETIIEINEHVELAKWWVIYSNTAAWMGVTFFVVSLLLLIFSWVALSDGDWDWIAIIGTIWSLVGMLIGGIVSFLWLGA